MDSRSQWIVACDRPRDGDPPRPSAGPLANAAEVESVTPLVINVARYNDDMHDVGVTFE